MSKNKPCANKPCAFGIPELYLVYANYDAQVIYKNIMFLYADVTEAISLMMIDDNVPFAYEDSWIIDNKQRILSMLDDWVEYYKRNDRS